MNDTLLTTSLRTRSTTDALSNESQLKQLLGKKHRFLVGQARRMKQSAFVDQLTAEQAFLIRRGLRLSPDKFWRVVRGQELIELPETMRHVSDVLLCQVPKKKRQLLLPME